MKIVTKKSKGQKCVGTSSQATKFRNPCKIDRVLCFQAAAVLLPNSDL